MVYDQHIPPPPQHYPGGDSQFPRGVFQHPNPFGADPRRTSQVDLHDDLPQRVHSMDIRSEQGEPRRRSMSRTPSLHARSLQEGRPMRKREMYKFVKLGEDWMLADRQFIAVPENDLSNFARRKSRSGTVTEQMSSMGDKRRLQIQNLIRERADLTGDSWEPCFIETNYGGKNSRKVRSMDVVIARVTEPIQTSPKVRATPTTAFGKVSDISQPRRASSQKYHDGGRRRSARAMDPDVFGNAKVFEKSGRPLPLGIDGDSAAVVGLPDHIPEDGPIGKRPEKHHDDDSNSLDDIINGGGGGGGGGGGKGKYGHGDDAIVEVIGGDPLHGDLDDILGGRGRGKKKHGKLSRQSSRRRSRSRKSAHTNAGEHRGPLRDDRTRRYFDDSSVSSDEKGFGDFDDDSLTSESIHRGAYRERRYSKGGYREHFAGPSSPPSPRDRQRYQGERIIIPERTRPALPHAYTSPQRQIEYNHVSPLRSPSPRGNPPPAVFYPHELAPRERRASNYMDDQVSREYVLRYREDEVRRREDAVRRNSVYGGEGYYR